MGVLDLEVQRERRVELLREAEGKRAFGRRRSDDRHQRRSGTWRLASLWTIGR